MWSRFTGALTMWSRFTWLVAITNGIGCVRRRSGFGELQAN